MIPYIAVSIFPVICSFLHLRCSFFKNENIKKRSENIWVAISLLPMFILLAFRNQSMGADTGTYWDLYRFASKVSFSELCFTQKMEPGFLVVEWVFAKMFPKPEIFQIIYVGFYFVACFLFIVKNTKEKFLFVFLFCTLGLFKFFFTGIRQCIAICICLFSYSAVKDRHIFKYLAIILIAGLFHKSAFFFLPVYFVYTLKHNKINLIIYISLIIVCTAIIIPVFPYFASLIGYGDYDIEFTGNGFIRFFIYFFLLLSTVFIKNNRCFDDEERGIFNISLIFMFLWVLRLMTRSTERIALYFLPYYSLFLSSRLGRVLGEETKESKVLKLFICWALLGLFLYTITTDNIVPYKTFFD